MNESITPYLSPYIHDGYTVNGYIEADERIHAEVRFTYRPVLAQDRSVIMRQIQMANDPRKEEAIAAAAIAGYVKSWDIRKPKEPGSDELVSVPIKASEVLRLNVRLTNRLYRIVMGDSAPDEDPNDIAASGESDAEKELQAALNGVAPEDDAKN